MAIYVYDKSGNKKAWAGAEDDASLSKLGLSKTQPVTKSVSTPVSSNNTTADKLYQEIVKGNSHMITDASGKKMTLTQNAIDRQGMGAFIDANGNFINSENRSPNQGSSKQSNRSINSLPIDPAFTSAKNSLIQQLKQRIAEQKQALNPMRNQTEVGRANMLRTALEQNANNGDRGGIGRQELLGVNTSADNQLNAINLQESNIDKQGNADISSAASQYDLEALKAAIQQQNVNAQQSQQDFQNKMAESSLTGTYNGSPTLEGQQLQQQNTDTAKQNFIDTIGRFSNDFTAQKNIVANDGDTSNDWQIALLEAAANKKRADAQAKYQEQGYVSEDIANALGLKVGTMTEVYKNKLDTATQNEQVNNALKIFAQLGYVTPEMAAILSAYGLPTDTESLNAIKTYYSVNKPYYKPEGSGGDTPWYLK